MKSFIAAFYQQYALAGCAIKLIGFYAQESFLDARGYLGHMVSADFTVAELGVPCWQKFMYSHVQSFLLKFKWVALCVV